MNGMDDVVQAQMAIRTEKTKKKRLQSCFGKGKGKRRDVYRERRSFK